VEKYLPHAILANDISGIVEKIGSDVQRFSVGDHIFGQSNILSAGPDQAGLQQFCILDANFAALIPLHISFDEAATFPVNAIASFIALFDSSGLDLAPKFLGHGVDYANERFSSLEVALTVGNLPFSSPVSQALGRLLQQRRSAAMGGNLSVTLVLLILQIGRQRMWKIRSVR
jgi:hypothetical protein